MREKFSQAHETHRDMLARKLADARKRDGTGAPIYYIGGYCSNPVCDVRDVLYRVKDLDVTCSVKDSRCPSCRLLLLAGSAHFDVDVVTREEWDLLQRQRAEGDRDEKRSSGARPSALEIIQCHDAAREGGR